MTEDVLVERGDVAVVTINRPEKRNALTVATTQAVAAAMAELGQSAKAIVITGAGEGFSAGGDFDELVTLSEQDPSTAAERLYSGYQAMIRAIRDVDVPVIAAINGHAMGAGMDLALCCDLRVCASSAKLGQVWVRLGIIPGTGGAFWVTALAGPARAAQMLLTGEPIDAATAGDWGLVNEVVAPDQVMPRSLEIANAIASQPPGALRANKRALDAVIRPMWEAALMHAKQVQPTRFMSDEFKQALAARKSRSS